MSTKFSVFLLFLALVGATFFTTPTTAYAASKTPNLDAAVARRDRAARLRHLQGVVILERSIRKNMEERLQAVETETTGMRISLDLVEENILKINDFKDNTGLIPVLTERVDELAAKKPANINWLWALVIIILVGVIWLYLKAYGVNINNPSARSSSEEEKEALSANDGVPPDAADDGEAEDEPEAVASTADDGEPAPPVDEQPRVEEVQPEPPAAEPASQKDSSKKKKREKPSN